jgi:hypothetical protein
MTMAASDTINKIGHAFVMGFGAGLGFFLAYVIWHALVGEPMPG